VLLGSEWVKAARRMMMKLTTGLVSDDHFLLYWFLRSRWSANPKKELPSFNVKILERNKGNPE